MLCVSYAANFEQLEFNGIGKQEPQNIFYAPFQKLVQLQFLYLNPFHTYSTIMKLGSVIPYLKISKKYMNHVTHPSSSAERSIFSPEFSKSLYIKNQIYIVFWYIISNFLNFFVSLKVVLINIVTILMISAEMFTLGLLKIKVF